VAEAKTSWPRPKFWPPGHFGLEDLTSLLYGVLNSDCMKELAPTSHGCDRVCSCDGFEFELNWQIMACACLNEMYFSVFWTYVLITSLLQF